MKKYPVEYNWLNRPKAKMALEDVVDFLEDNGISVWLAFGTLLGAYREGTFIVYDYDVDLGMAYADFKKFHALRISNPELFFAANIIAGPYILGPDRVPHSMCVSAHNIKIDIYVWYEKDDKHNLVMAHTKDLDKPYQIIQVPASYHKNLVKIDFLGREYYCPGETDKYLEIIYGDNWNKRVKTGHARSGIRHMVSLDEFIPKEVIDEQDY